MKLEDRVAVVTGAGSGIGRAIALALGREGARVVVVDRVASTARQTASLIRGEGGAASRVAMPVTCDVSRPDDVKSMVQGVVEAYGRIDVLVNNAGVATPGTAIECTLDEWGLNLDVNITGAFLCCKEILPIMVEHNRGKIINISSIAAIIGIASRAASCASKAAVHGLTRSLAVDYGKHNINANVVCPGFVQTSTSAATVSREELQDRLKVLLVGEPGQPTDIASIVVFLASDESRYITGQVITADGGWSAH
jgi:NAD(P)-dependent dehydrogenase (short-subunit alcohol dehydrogenase family)